MAHCLSTRSTKGVRKLKDNFSSLISVVYLDMESFKEFVTSTQSRGCFMDRPTTLTNDASVKFSEYRTNLPEKCSSFAPLTFELLSAMSIAKTVSTFQKLYLTMCHSPPFSFIASASIFTQLLIPPSFVIKRLATVSVV